MRFLLAGLATVLLLSCQQEDVVQSEPSSSDDNSPLGHTRNILSFGPRPPGSTAAREVRNYVTTILEEAGWTVGAQTTTAQTPLGARTFTNLIARFPTNNSTEVWKQPIDGLLCAHLDSKFYSNKRFLGADDAASACGLILTMAQEFALQPEKATRLELIFFDGEEALTEDMGPKANGIFDGLYGSRAYATRWRNTSRKPSFGILLDMVGHRDLSIKVPADSPPNLLAVMRQAAKTTGHSAHFGVAAGSILDDHVPLNHAGIPTIDIIGDFQRHKWWHTPQDNLDLISADSLAISQEVVTEMLNQLLE